MGTNAPSEHAANYRPERTPSQLSDASVLSIVKSIWRWGVMASWLESQFDCVVTEGVVQIVNRRPRMIQLWVGLAWITVLSLLIATALFLAFVWNWQWTPKPVLHAICIMPLVLIVIPISILMPIAGPYALLTKKEAIPDMVLGSTNPSVVGTGVTDIVMFSGRHMKRKSDGHLAPVWSDSQSFLAVYALSYNTSGETLCDSVPIFTTKTNSSNKIKESLKSHARTFAELLAVPLVNTNAMFTTNDCNGKIIWHESTMSEMI